MASTITPAGILRASERDPQSGKYLRPAEQVALSSHYIEMQDPGRDSTSLICASQYFDALAKGYTNL